MDTKYKASFMIRLEKPWSNDEDKLQQPPIETQK